MACEKSKILIFGATGYLGKYMVKESLEKGHPTSIFVRPLKPDTNASKLERHREYESMGVTIFQGEYDEHEKLVSAIQQVDIVISTLAIPQHPLQLKIINAIKDAGNIKRFVPSEFGNEADRVFGLPPFQNVLDNKQKIRRATEAAGICYTYISANSFCAYFADYFLHPNDPSDELTVYGPGQAKAALNFEEDVAAYTIKLANDPRAANRLVILRAPGNIVSQMDLINLWEKKTGRTFKKTHVPEEEIIKLSETLPYPDNVPPAVLHNIFVKGDQTSFELTKEDLEASQLYPDYKYTSVDAYLDICLVNAPKPKRAAF